MRLSEKSREIQDKFLCMLHDHINKELFEDKLQHIFCCFNEISDTLDGCYYANDDDLGARIEISYRFLEDIEQFGEFDSPYMLFIVLLHEMIHQYCDENGIQSSAQHDKTFCDIAAKFGLETHSKDGNVVDKERLLQKALEVVPADMFECIDEKAAEFDALY